MALKNKQTIPKDSPLSRIVAQRTGNWLLAHVNEHLESSSTVRADKGWFHPSALSNPCDALLAFAYMGAIGKSTTGAKLQRIFDHGTGRDEYWKRYLHDSGLSLMGHWGGSPKERKLASIERSFEIPNLRIRGEFDDMAANPTTREVYIVEFKTKREDLFEAMRAPDPDHVIQVHPYMFAKGVLQAMFIYECKNCQDVKTYVQKFDGELWNSLTTRLANIVQLVENKKLPWRTPMKNDSQCSFFTTCGGFEFKE